MFTIKNKRINDWIGFNTKKNYSNMRHIEINSWMLYIKYMSISLFWWSKKIYVNEYKFCAKGSASILDRFWNKFLLLYWLELYNMQIRKCFIEEKILWCLVSKIENIFFNHLIEFLKSLSSELLANPYLY